MDAVEQDLQNDALIKETSSRWVATKGAKLNILVLYNDVASPTVHITEADRASRLSSDLSTLAQLLPRFPGILGLTKQPGFAYQSYTLVKPRANLTVDVTPLSQATASTSGEDGQKLETIVITGTAEHLFLSANAASSNARQVKYDAATQSLQPATKPTEFTIGLNFSIVDLSATSENQWLNFVKGLYIGGMVEGSSHPFNQVGIVVGARHSLPYLSPISFNTVSPYVGLTWLKNDKANTAAGSTSIRSRYGRGSFVFGLSLNLSEALSWVSPASPTTAAKTTP